MIGSARMKLRRYIVGSERCSCLKEQQNIGQVFSPLSRRDLSDFVPKGLEDSARGFNPWKHVRPKTRPEVAEDIRDRRFVWSKSAQPRHRCYRPLWGGPFFNWHLGLKPQAESFSPFGTQDLRELRSNTPVLHHSAPQESRTKTSTKEPVRLTEPLCIGLLQNLGN